MSTSAEYVGASETTWKESSERTEARSSGLEVEVLLRQTKVEDKEADAMSQESRGETKAERISFLFHLVNPNLSQNGKAILATLSTTHHLLYTSSKQSLKYTYRMIYLMNFDDVQSDEFSVDTIFIHWQHSDVIGFELPAQLQTAAQQRRMASASR